MKKIIIGLASLSILGAVACGGDDTVTPGVDSGGKDTSTLPDTSPPGDASGNDAGNPPPKLGVQIDRIGRPAINTAANNVFNPDPTTSGMAKDAYNAAADPTTWVTSFKSEAAKNLAVFDGLDTVCGNQLAAKMTVGPGQYDPLATVLLDDRLYLNTAGTTCTTYLAVEANALGVLKNTDCGGRGLAYEVMDTTYGAVAGCSMPPCAPISDGVSPDPTKTGGKTFPYLAPAK